MYQFKPVTKRIQHMHDLIRDRVIQVDSERAMITTDVVRDYEHMIPAIRRPMILKAMCERMTVRVEDFELIVGNTSKNFCGAGIDSDWVESGGFRMPFEAGNGH